MTAIPTVPSPRLLLKMKQPFYIYVIWHPSFKEGVDYFNLIYSAFNRKVKEPWTRGIGIPVFLRTRSAENKKRVPEQIDWEKATHNAVIVLSDPELVDAGWDAYFDQLVEEADQLAQSTVYPVALEQNGINLSEKIPTLNFIRLFQKETKEEKQKFLIDKLAHEFCRLLYEQPRISEAEKKETAQPVKLFLSHAKADGVEITDMLKTYIEKDTGLKTFFDVNDIPAGEQFSSSINEGVAGSTLISIHTDAYTTRKWCRAEVLQAKLNNCPMVVVDALDEGEFRSFPYMANAPVIRWNQAPLQKIVATALLTTLNYKYQALYLDYILENYGFSKENYQVLGNSPELLDLAYKPLANAENFKTILYPDPPVGLEEVTILSKYNERMMLTTPLQLISAKTGDSSVNKKNLAVGISISESGGSMDAGVNNLHLQDLTVELARYLLAADYRIAYGGDIKYSGDFNFAELLKEILLTYRAEYKEITSKIDNYAAAPVFDKLNTSFRSDLKPLFNFIRVDAPKEFEAVDDPSQLPDAEKRYYNARCFTEMREVLNSKLAARIILGGKLSGFAGIYPGLVEEAVFALKSKIPVFLIGAFGGCANVIIAALKGGAPTEITEDFQLQKTPAFRELLAAYHSKAAGGTVETINYSEVVSFLNRTGVAGLNNGLSVEENEILFASINVLEIVGLVLKGLSRSIP
jgi:hypothetical protein